MFTLTGKKALVTGASGGIGGAIAQALARQGAEVALSGTRVEALEAAAKEVSGKTHIGTIDPVKDATDPGRREIRMADLDVPAECDTILLKLWVGGAEGATTLLNNLTYTVQMSPEDIRNDENFGKAEVWEATDVRLSHTDDSATVELADGKSFGSALYQPLLPRSDEGRLLVHASAVTGGTLTLQIVAFGPEGRYIASVDAIPSFTSGWRGIALNRIAWPEGTTHFRVKLWLGGTGGASAVLDRLLLLAR